MSELKEALLSMGESLVYLLTAYAITFAAAAVILAPFCLVIWVLVS